MVRCQRNKLRYQSSLPDGLRSGDGDVHTVSGVTVRRDVRYASQHPRNTLDIYSPIDWNWNSRLPVLLFIHGGMWLRGSKEQHVISSYDLASHLASRAYQRFLSESDTKDKVNDDPDTEGNSLSNVGMTVASNGGVVCVMNYRLAGDEGAESGHPHQVMDCARAIAYILGKQDLAHEHASGMLNPNLYIGGHSAGAHLGALALSDPQYLNSIFEELGMNKHPVLNKIAGYVGISGVYNLRRLKMSPLAPITIGAAFVGNQAYDATYEASPVHVLLRQYAPSSEEAVPLLAQIPTLLVNAESDFHLLQDSIELQTALRSYDFPVSEADSNLQRFALIANRDHFSIMREFGTGLWSFKRPATADDVQLYKEEDWSINGILNQSYTTMRSAFSAFKGGSIEQDETANHVLDFMGIKQR